MLTEEALAKSATLPPPVGGWNARDPLEEMSPFDAITLDNVFPEVGQVKLFPGYRVHSTGMGTGAVQTVAEYVGSAGARKLISAANGNIYDASTLNATATSLKSSLTNNAWQTCMFRDRLIMVNGDDQPQQIDSTPAASDAAYTGVTDDATLITVNSFKNRLYFIEKNTAKVWYGAVDTITGALTSFDVQSLLQLGGHLMFAGSMSPNTGSGLADLFVMMSNQGEVLVYSGDYPGGTWSIVGRYRLPPPLGRRAFIYTDADLVVITEGGALPLSAVINAGGTVSEGLKFTDKIRSAFNSAAKLYASNFQWSGLVYPRGHMSLINVPVANNTQSHQYAINQLTGAWCRGLGINAISWCLFNQKPYFGGPDGKVYEFDSTKSYNGTNINADIETAFSHLGSNRKLKRFVLARPIITSDAPLNFYFGVSTDFQRKAVSETFSTVGVAGSAWDSSPWDISPWDSANLYNQDWRTIYGVGRYVSTRFKGSFLNTSFNISAIDLIYEPGGLI